MNTPAIKDLQEMVSLIKANGYPGESFIFTVPLNYACVIHDELASIGVSIARPQAGDEINLELSNRGKVTMQVH